LPRAGEHRYQSLSNTNHKSHDSMHNTSNKKIHQSLDMPRSIEKRGCMTLLPKYCAKGKSFHDCWQPLIIQKPSYWLGMLHWQEPKSCFPISSPGTGNNILQRTFDEG